MLINETVCTKFVYLVTLVITWFVSIRIISIFILHVDRVVTGHLVSSASLPIIRHSHAVVIFITVHSVPHCKILTQLSIVDGKVSTVTNFIVKEIWFLTPVAGCVTVFSAQQTWTSHSLMNTTQICSINATDDRAVVEIV